MTAVQTFEEYQNSCARTAVYPEVSEGTIVSVNYAALGLGNEAGEVQGKVKKAWRDDNGEITPERRQAILDELGDVMWYAARLASELDATLAEVCQANLDKLYDRLDRGVIQGSGDNR